MSDDIFGQSSYGGGVKKNYWKLKDGSATFRILPALGDLAKEGRWSVFWKIHFGYKNSKGQLRLFESPLVKNNKTKMIEVPDLALERIEVMKAKFEAAKKAGDQNTIAALDKYVGQKGMYNLDSNHYMNVMDMQGNIGILKIRHRAKVALDAEIKKLREQNIDPLSPDNGRFFTFTRTGMGLDTTFQVVVAQETVDVPGFGPMKRDLVHKLSAEIGARCAIRKQDGTFKYVEAANLSTLYKKLSSEDVTRLVKASELATGKSPIVDELFDAKGDVEQPPVDEDSSDYADTKAPVITPVAAQVAAPVAVAPAVVTPAPVQAAIAVKPAAVASVFAPAEAPMAVVAPTPVAQVSEQSAEEFLKSLGL